MGGVSRRRKEEAREGKRKESKRGRELKRERGRENCGVAVVGPGATL